MNGMKIYSLTVLIGILIVFSRFLVNGNEIKISNLSECKNNDSFYFVHITDTHVMHKNYDQYEEYK